MADEPIDLKEARQRLEAAKQPNPMPVDPVAALGAAVGKVADITGVLIEKIGAIEESTAVQAAQIAALIKAIETLTRATVGAVADIRARLPPAA
jgi:hypothetical protein